jgi:hypothetical protein
MLIPRRIFDSNLVIDMWIFPLHTCKGIPINQHPGAFGVQRKHERHTGVDLYCKNRDEVFALEDGIVVGIEKFTGEHDNSPWWNNTECILIAGGTGVICYGEITPYYRLEIGSKVFSSKIIGNVFQVLKDGKERSDIPGHSLSMLHIELYPHGTTVASNGFSEILRDPTPYLIHSTGGFNQKLLTIP